MDANDEEDDGARSQRLAPLWLALVALTLAIAGGYIAAATAPDFDTLALGDQTQSLYGRYQGDKIFCGSPAEAPECLEPAARRKLAQRVLWLGNSQLHAINQSRPGDVTAPVLLARRLRPRGIEVQAMSFPNGSLAEFYLAYLFERRAAPIDTLVVPLFLDDTREGEVRDILRPLAIDPAIRPRLAASPAGRAVLAALPPGGDSSEPGAGDTLQARSEAAITRWLERCCGFQTMRENARGQFAIQIFNLRNTVFNVTAQSVRPIIPNTYAFNLAALDQLLADAARDGTRVITYVPPLRQDVRPPYVQADYARFKAQTRALALRHGAVWIDLDTIVPGALWGTKASPRLGGGVELDFMHFQAPGHIALERRIAPIVETTLR